jgi:outer membrane protein OmpA-like peptidoglycan-associated protein
VPKSRLDDAAKVTQSLRSENAQLKDQALSLKGENSDLTRRALNEGRKITALEEANDRLESSVQAYIDEREDLNDAFQRFKRTAQAAVIMPSGALQARLKSFSNGHPGTSYDTATGVLTVEADQLFVAGSDRIKPAATAWLTDLATILSDPEARQRALVVTGHAADLPVRVASTDEPISPGELSLSRAVRVRDVLAEKARRDPSKLGVSGLGNLRPLVTGGDDRSQAKNARIEIDLSQASLEAMARQ